MMNINEVTELRYRLRDTGFHLVPLYGKEPPVYGRNNKYGSLTGWQTAAGAPPEQIAMWARTWPDALGTGLLTARTPAIDLDVLMPDVVGALEHLAREHFADLGVFLVRIGLPPKRAILLRTEQPFKKITRSYTTLVGGDALIEVLGDGQQLAAFGTHPVTRKPYTWFGGFPGDVRFDELPLVTLEMVQRFVDQADALLVDEFQFQRAGFVHIPKSNGADHATGTDVQASPGRLADALAVVPNDCHWDDWNRIGMSVWRASGGSEAGFAVFDAWSRKSPKYVAAHTRQRWDHLHRSPPTALGAGTIFYLADRYTTAWRDPPPPDLPPEELSAREQPRKSPQPEQEQEPPPAEPPPPEGGEPPESPPPEPPKGDSGGPPDEPDEPVMPPDWYQRTDKGYLESNLYNAMTALDQERAIMNLFAFDEMLRATIVLRPLSFSMDAEPPEKFRRRPVTDVDVAKVRKWMQNFGFRHVTKDTVYDAIHTHAHAHRFHPVRDYLDALRWDGVERLPTWLQKAFGVTDNAYTRAIGTMFPIAMVARIKKPGCKVDNMPILEGEQGELKSQACAILAGPYFSDQLPDITSKDASQHLRGKWLVEVAELRAYSRAAVDHFKEFVVRQVERYRPPYGRNELHEPRQCVFIGSTNKDQYLRDETGNRRYWPLKIGNIDLKWLRENRDQIFAEAVHRYRAGEKWWPDRDFEKKYIRPVQDSRFEVDAWEGPIGDYLAEVKRNQGDKARTTLIEIATTKLGLEAVVRLGTTDQRRITAVLKRLGWQADRINRARFWSPIPEQPELELDPEGCSDR